MTNTARAAIAVGVMCKAPRPGFTKTRLAATFGDEFAAALSGCFLRDTGTLIDRLAAPLGLCPFGVYTPIDAKAEVGELLPRSFSLTPQTGSDFADLMQDAFADLFVHSAAGVVIVGADIPTLPAEVMAQAVFQLREPGDRVVLGPARDGGYYLIGLKTSHPELFRDMPWSTPEVYGVTLERAAGIGLPVAALPVWYDVDDDESFAWLIDDLSRGDARLPSGQPAPSPAEATRAFLQAHGFAVATEGRRSDSAAGSGHATPNR